MIRITQCFQPPLYWQQFEDLTEGVFRAIYGDSKPTKFGRPGQAQEGVDVFGRDGNGNLIGIQCKRMDERDENSNPRPGGKLLEKHLNSEIKEAKKFTPQLHTWILATTAKRDANIQRYALQLDEKTRAKGEFGIQVWFWDDFITFLNCHHDLQRWYYDNVIQVNSSDDQDKIILELIGEAFGRPAFKTPLNQESPFEFTVALKDTQQAISTGELKDRETRRVIRKTIGGRRAIEDQTASKFIDQCYEELQALRDDFDLAIKNGAIQSQGGLLNIQQQLLNKLNQHRDAAIAHLNNALKHKGLKPV